MNNRFTNGFYLLDCFCFCSVQVQAQTATSLIATTTTNETPVGETGIIKGHLITTDNKPATEVSITLKGSNRFAVTDQNGNFIFRNVRTGNHFISNLTNSFNYYVHENYSINPIAPRQVAATIAYKF